MADVAGIDHIGLGPDFIAEWAKTVYPNVDMKIILNQPHLLTFAVRTFDVKGVEKRVAEAGLETQGAITMSRRHPEGHLLKWQVLR